MRMWKVSFGVVIAVFFCELQAAEIPITSLSDSGPETLREALLNALDGDILNFQSDLSGTILLESSLPDISLDLTIQGPTSGSVAIDGALQYQIFKVNSGVSSISNLQLVNGATSLGGAVLLQPLTSALMTNVSVSHCDGVGCASPIHIDTDATFYTQNLDISGSGNGLGKDISASSGSSFILVSDHLIEPQIVIEGLTSLLKTGDGAVHLFSPTPIDAELVIDQGSLVFNGATSQGIQVTSNGMLRGVSSCLSLINDGVVSPGNSIGTISVVNDYDQSGTLVIELSASSDQSDLLQVGGNAFLNGDLVITPDAGLYLKGDLFTFLTTGGSIIGSFTESFSTESGLIYTLNYFPTSIQIEILQNTISLGGDVFSGNTNKIASAFENTEITRDSDLFSVARALNTLGSASSLQVALNQLDPDLFLSAVWSDATTLYQISGIASSQQFSFCDMQCFAKAGENSCCPPRKEKRVWLNGIGERTSQSTNAGLIAFRTYTEGLLLGYDQRVCDPVTVGGYGGYTHSNLDWRDISHKGQTAINGYYASVYSSFCLRHLSFDASLLGSFYQYSKARKIDFAMIHRVAKSSSHGYGLLGHLGATGFVSVKKVDLFPFAKLDYISIWQSHFREHGAKSIDLIVNSTKTGFIHAEAGLIVSRRFCQSWGAIAPRVGLSWVYLGPTAGTDIKARFAFIPELISFQTSRHKFNAVSPMIALDTTINNCWWVSLSYKGEFAKDRVEQNLNLDVRWQF